MPHGIATEPGSGNRQLQEKAAGINPGGLFSLRIQFTVVARINASRRLEETSPRLSCGDPSCERDERVDRDGQRHEEHEHAEQRHDAGDEIVRGLRARDMRNDRAGDADQRECNHESKQDDERRSHQPRIRDQASDRHRAIRPRDTRGMERASALVSNVS